MSKYSNATKEQEASYKMEKISPCQCMRTFDEKITNQVIKSTMCSRESAILGKFNRKVISYAYYENHTNDPSTHRPEVENNVKFPLHIECLVLF